MTLGEKIVVYRKKEGMSQEKLASRLYVTRQAVSKWERDLSIPDVETLKKLAALMGTNLDSLLKDGGSRPGEFLPLGRTHYGFAAMYGIMLALVIAVAAALNADPESFSNIPFLLLGDLILFLLGLELVYMLAISLFPWGKWKLEYTPEKIRFKTFKGQVELPFALIESFSVKTHGNWPHGRLIVKTANRRYCLYPIRDVNQVKTLLDELRFGA